MVLEDVGGSKKIVVSGVGCALWCGGMRVLEGGGGRSSCWKDIVRISDGDGLQGELV